MEFAVGAAFEVIVALEFECDVIGPALGAFQKTVVERGHGSWGIYTKRCRRRSVRASPNDVPTGSLAPSAFRPWLQAVFLNVTPHRRRIHRLGEVAAVDHEHVVARSDLAADVRSPILRVRTRIGHGWASLLRADADAAVGRLPDTGALIDRPALHRGPDRFAVASADGDYQVGWFAVHYQSEASPFQQGLFDVVARDGVGLWLAQWFTGIGVNHDPHGLGS